MKKFCPKCRKSKSAKEFNRHSSHKDGYRSECRECQNSYNREYYRTHKDKWAFQENTPRRKKWKKKYHVKYYQANKIRIRKCILEHYYENWEQIRTYQNNPEIRERYREENKIWQRRYRESTKGKDTHQQYLARRRDTPEWKAIKIKGFHRRKALFRSCVINDLTSDEVEFMLKHAHHCPICEKPFNKTKRKKTIDHIIPMSKRGNNTLSNTQVICLSCNSRKKAEDYTKFNNGQLLMFV